TDNVNAAPNTLVTRTLCKDRVRPKSTLRIAGALHSSSMASGSASQSDSRRPSPSGGAAAPGRGSASFGSAWRARECVLLVCAAVILLFAPSDVYTLGRFSWIPFMIRLEWAGSILVTILALRKAEPHGVPIILNALAVLSTALYGALAML